MPRWSRDGTELFWQTPDGMLTAAAVLPGEGFRIAPPAPLFGRVAISGQAGARYGYRYGVHPDGDRFLVIAPDGWTMTPPVAFDVGLRSGNGAYVSMRGGELSGP